MHSTFLLKASPPLLLMLVQLVLFDVLRLFSVYMKSPHASVSIPVGREMQALDYRTYYVW